jgi:hypothetical protein
MAMSLLVLDLPIRHDQLLLYLAFCLELGLAFSDGGGDGEVGSMGVMCIEVYK